MAIGIASAGGSSGSDSKAESERLLNESLTGYRIRDYNAKTDDLPCKALEERSMQGGRFPWLQKHVVHRLVQ